MAASLDLLLEKACFFLQRVWLVPDDAYSSIRGDIHCFLIDNDVMHVVAGQPMVRTEIVIAVANVANRPFCGTDPNITVEPCRQAGCVFIRETITSCNGRKRCTPKHRDTSVGRDQYTAAKRSH